MSAYDNDPRVVHDGDAFAVTVFPDRADSPAGRVEPWVGGEWEAFGTVHGDFVRHFHGTADEAIRSLIGDPR